MAIIVHSKDNRLILSLNEAWKYLKQSREVNPRIKARLGNTLHSKDKTIIIEYARTEACQLSPVEVPQGPYEGLTVRNAPPWTYIHIPDRSEERPLRMRVLLAHELVHAIGGSELDAEVVEAFYCDAINEIPLISEEEKVAFVKGEVIGQFYRLHSVQPDGYRITAIDPDGELIGRTVLVPGW